MPIIESVDTKEPLGQGDLLEGRALFLTGAHSSAPDGEAEPAKASGKLSLVLSRPCVAMRSEFIVVAPVERFSQQPPANLSTFAQVDFFLTSLRDSPKSPDTFYLGQLPGK